MKSRLRKIEKAVPYSAEWEILISPEEHQRWEEWERDFPEEKKNRAAAKSNREGTFDILLKLMRQGKPHKRLPSPPKGNPNGPDQEAHERTIYTKRAFWVGVITLAIIAIVSLIPLIIKILTVGLIRAFTG
jgi:hypothetical protein